MKNKILFVACLIFGLLFINAGLNKFFNYIPAPTDMPEGAMKMFMGMMQISWLIPLVAAAEITGGVLFIIKRYRALGAVILTPGLAGIILTHLTVLPSGLFLAAMLLGIYIWVIIENWEKYLPMVRS